ncbi:MAG: hypothetical protein IJ072_08275 [Oscillospiraceae bacterium]|nr:hypothetical protein [Oscillospiraceae bacterium]
MWNYINDALSIKAFMEKVDYFHDSCIKEMKYLSGAYVQEHFSMYPVNDKRLLCVVIQLQKRELPMIELVFEGLRYLKLFPADEEYTCEILDSAMFLKDDCIYWCDSGDICEENLNSYEGTLICAKKLKWRIVEGCMGEGEFYRPVK